MFEFFLEMSKWNPSATYKSNYLQPFSPNSLASPIWWATTFGGDATASQEEKE